MLIKEAPIGLTWTSLQENKLVYSEFKGLHFTLWKQPITSSNNKSTFAVMGERRSSPPTASPRDGALMFIPDFSSSTESKAAQMVAWREDPPHPGVPSPGPLSKILTSQCF